MNSRTRQVLEIKQVGSQILNYHAEKIELQSMKYKSDKSHRGMCICFEDTVVGNPTEISKEENGFDLEWRWCSPHARCD